MKNVVINSLTDEAGTNIHDRLLEQFGFEERPSDEYYDGSPVYSRGDTLLATSKKQIIFVEDLDTYYPNSRYIFISRHRAESGVPSLTVHFTGNFGDSNEFGGKPHEIAKFSPSLLKKYFLSLHAQREKIPRKYEITLEATHHGPTSLANPVLFVELGSSPKEWGDEEAARAIAHALMETLESIEVNRKSHHGCALGFGGTHYAKKFNEFIRLEEFSLGPIMPKYGLGFLNEEFLEQLTKKGDEKITHAALDMKGLSSHKENVLKLARDFGLDVLKL